MSATEPLGDPARPSRERNLQILLGAFLALCIGVAVAVALSWSATLQQLDRLRSTDSDNLTWSLTQIHVDNLQLQSAILGAMRSGPDAGADLGGVRLHFDLLYSRTTSLSGTPLQRLLESNGVDTGAIALVREALTQFIAQVDGPDPDLIAALPDMLQRFAALDPQIRRMTVEGVRMVELDAGRRREELRAASERFALASALMFVVMAVVILYVIGLNRVITREARKRLLVQENLRAAQEASLDAIVVFAPDGRILSWNPAASQCLGLDTRTADTLSMPALFPDDDQGRHFRADLQAYEKTGVSSLIDAGRITMTMRCADARLVPVEAAFVPARTTEGQRLIVGFLRDVSERIEAEKRLRSALHAAKLGNETKRKILLVLSHELRTPLQGLTGMLESLHHELADSPRAAAMVEAAARAATHVSRVANNALDSSELLSGADVAPALETFDLARLLEGLREEHRDLAARQGTRVDLALHRPAPVFVRTDRRVVRLALSNLIHNAVQFTRNGSVVIDATVNPDEQGREMVHVRIADTGPGIALEHQARVFNDFETLEDSLERESRGAGLGLGIVRRAVDLLDGSLSLNSAPGDGTRIVFGFPVQLMPDTAARSREPRAVLVVEDNPTNREALVAMLARLGVGADSAADGIEAVERADRRPYDLILMDIAMPRMDGIAATRRIRAGTASGDARIVAVSAYADPADRQRFLDAGMDNVLTKPVGLADLQTLTGLTPLPPDGAPGGRMPVDRPARPARSAHLDELIETLGAERVATLIRQLSDETAQVLDHARTPGSDHAQVAANLHRIAGAVALFGLDDLRTVLLAAEDAVLAGDPDAAEQMIAAAGLLCDSRLSHLQELLADPA